MARIFDMDMLRQIRTATDLRDPGEAGQVVSADERKHETIFALSSGAGVAGVAVIRVSGPAADKCLSELTGRALPPPRYASLRRLLDEDGEVLDEAMVLRFAENGSYTGEAVVELHCHGGVAVVRRLLGRLEAMPGLRLAQPGEFTRRALEAGRLDLTDVEALGDLLAAETEAQRRRAMAAFVGGLRETVDGWRGQLVRALALVEVTIDWADEDVPEEVGPEVAELIGRVRHGMRAELAGAEAAERLRSGFEVALVGAPNAGKSSLLNVLAGREAAIASAVPGTTRDVIELRYDLHGLPVTFLDMAGVRECTDEVEALGVERARARAGGAAVRVFLDAPDAPLGAWAADLVRDEDIVLRSKTDLTGEPGGVSVVSGAGIEALLVSLRRILERRAGEAGLVGRMRQRKVLAEVDASLECAGATLGSAPELLAEEIRAALRALDRLTGRMAVEDVLGEVFGSFCLGK